ncbi:hypothetical protein AYO45_04150 [Gammaproteobacteria bacterium SCGC AG-212-F23]|nr:hypothetical protein AYO45_04150 [Gammaproteobacteria bacterium SCGC AG-212-F23]
MTAASNLLDHKIDNSINWTVPNGASFRTIYYQGMSCSQTQMAKYIGSEVITTTTGQTLSCSGRNGFQPINVVYKPFIGKEIQDVNLTSYTCNPLKWIWSCGSHCSNGWYGFQIGAVDPLKATEPGSVTSHRPVFSNVSIGQKSDIESHHTKYTLWDAQKDKFKNEKLILYGVSRGGIATLNAFAQYQYPEVVLVVVEGCAYSVEDVIDKRHWAPMACLKRNFLSCCTQYQTDGPSPAKSITKFPENIPVAFIGSEIDKEVPWQSSERTAMELFQKGRNDVYLLKLKKSNHSTLMFDDANDRMAYETFIHAYYKRYSAPHIPKLAQAGANLLDECQLKNNVASGLGSNACHFKPVSVSVDNMTMNRMDDLTKPLLANDRQLFPRV